MSDLIRFCPNCGCETKFVRGTHTWEFFVAFILVMAVELFVLFKYSYISNESSVLAATANNAFGIELILAAGFPALIWSIAHFHYCCHKCGCPAGLSREPVKKS